MDTNSRAITGSWKDYSTGYNLLSVADPLSYLIIGVSTVWLSWSTKYIKRFLGNLVLLVHLHRNRPQKEPNENDPRIPLLNPEPRQPSTKNVRSLAKVYKGTNDVRDLLWLSLFSKYLTPGGRCWLFLFTAVVAGASAGMIIGGYYAAKVRTTGPARLASDHCGLWIFDGEKRPEAATRAGLLDLEKEERAAQYAGDCYTPSSRFDATRCDFFYRPRLPFSAVSYTNACPFKNDICGQNQAVTFKTELIDGNDIGINSPTAPKFRRSTTCSPLSMEYPFVQNTTENGTTTYYYYYGEKTGVNSPLNYTFKTVGDPWDRLAPVYDLFAYSTASDPPLWQPLPELTPPEYSTVTIIFISSLRILYEKSSDDPIFPADMAWSAPGDSKRWFRNSDPRARPLACINTIEVCAADETNCWSTRVPDNITDLKWTPEYVLMYTALYHTDIYDSIKKRLGRGLLAQKLVSGYLSDALSDYHWVDEIENMVKIAHARTQINAWSVASGEDSIHEGQDGYDSVTAEYGDICGRYKFNPQGYASFHLAAFIIIILSWPVLCILTSDWNPVENTLKNCFTHIKSMCHNLVSSSRQDSGSSTGSETIRQAHAEESLPSTPIAGSSKAVAIQSQVRSGSQSESRAETRTEREERSVTDESTTTPEMSPQARSERQAHKKPIAKGSATETPLASDDAQIEWEPLLYWGVIRWLLRFPYIIISTLIKLIVSCCSYIWRCFCGPNWG